MSKENLTNIVFDKWQNTLQPFGVDQMAMRTAFTQLVEIYSIPNRHYHNLTHINHVLDIIQTLENYTENLTAVKLAAWFHDVVYDTQAKDNEEKSAEYTNKFLSNLGIPIKQIHSVTHLILNTKHHQPDTDDLDSQVLLDADLAILAVNSNQYWEYTNAIRQEYSWLSTPEYITGRKQVLKEFLQRPKIYSTPLMFEFAELPARANLKAEILRLFPEN
jgi:predicted metal-dependent HD superfamily phosphohydrolase